jgi:hypothetical protein
MERRASRASLWHGRVHLCTWDGKAPGHVASARAGYRRISREWHAWLGSALYLGGRVVASDPTRTGDYGQDSSRPFGKRKTLEEMSLNRGQRQRTGSSCERLFGCLHVMSRACDD